MHTAHGTSDPMDDSPQAIHTKSRLFQHRLTAPKIKSRFLRLKIQIPVEKRPPQRAEPRTGDRVSRLCSFGGLDSLIRKGRNGSLTLMKSHPRANNLWAHRKRTGLSQRDLGRLVGYVDEGSVSRHERSQSTPTILIALSYEAIFRAPLSKLFAGLSAEVARSVEAKLVAFEQELGSQSGRGPNASRTAQKLMWLKQRKSA